ncbi:MAG TPA: HTH domain-containing protein, partial [Candidatus Aenigmarchaeota archaeon]|nr:HTH domain-containing protein [Candidatus Aenigmarchaeota archaeon]
MDIEKKIIRILKKDREGITISDMANKLKVHRHTLTKYIYRLQG